MSGEKILVVDDEIELAYITRDYLKREGYAVVLAHNGIEAMQMFDSENPLLVILDVLLPRIDGLEVLRRIRQKSEVPVLMISAKDSEVDKIIGLGLGSDDYISKPYSLGELAARVKSNLRRYTVNTKPASNKYDFGEFSLDEERREVIIRGKPSEFTQTEFDLLKTLVAAPHRVFTKENLYNTVWGYNDFGDINTVTVYIKKIREKIEKDIRNPRFITTVWGVGYKFVP